MSRLATFAKITAKPGSFDALLERVREFTTQILAEDGTEFYCVNTSADDPDAIYFFEVYRDEDAFNAHIASTAMAEFAKDLGALAEPAMEMRQLVPVENKGLAGG